MAARMQWDHFGTMTPYPRRTYLPMYLDNQTIASLQVLCTFSMVMDDTGWVIRNVHKSHEEAHLHMYICPVGILRSSERREQSVIL